MHGSLNKIKSLQNSSTEGGMASTAPSLAAEQLATDSCWGREEFFFSRSVLIEILSVLQWMISWPCTYKHELDSEG